MNPILRNVIGVILGCIVGGFVNISIISFGGAEMDMEKLEAMANSWTFNDAIIPFAAHAGGTLVGALVAVFIGATHKMTLGLIVGIFFLLGGITACFMIPAPKWFMAMDLLLAYIPMGWIAGKIGGKKT